MGFYIQVKERFNKALQIVDTYGGEFITPPRQFSSIPEGKALIIVVQNPMFESAGFIFDEREFRDFTLPGDPRKKEYVLMDWDIAVRLSGFNKRP